MFPCWRVRAAKETQRDDEAVTCRGHEVTSRVLVFGFDSEFDIWRVVGGEMKLGRTPRGQAGQFLEDRQTLALQHSLSHTRGSFAYFTSST